MPAIYACFIASGVAGLVYEVLWAKYLALYIGSTSSAQVIVLATFMGGLALGSQLLGKLADRTPEPLRLYAFLEFGIGVYALLFDALFPVGRGLFLATAQAAGVGAGALALGKILGCALSILLPTILMGGTFPAMSRFLIRRTDQAGPTLSRLYFLNALGAAFGCLLAGFFLIQAFGLKFTLVIGAMLNITAGLVTLAIQRAGSVGSAAPGPAAESETAATPAENAPLPRGTVILILTGLFVSGAVSMIYEVAWIRFLTLVLGGSTYAFCLMLATFIFGLSLGSFLLSFRKKESGYLGIFGLSTLGVGLCVLLMLPVYLRVPYWFNQIACSLSRDTHTFPLYLSAQAAICFLVMLLPTILQGITFPAGIKALVASTRGLGGNIGRAYAVNTIGTVVGSAGAGYLLLPWLGLQHTFEAAIILNVALGLALLLRARETAAWRRTAALALCAVLAAGSLHLAGYAAWDNRVLGVGAYRIRERCADMATFVRQATEGRKILFHRDGIDASVSVLEMNSAPPQRSLIVNGKADASTALDMPTQKLLGHLPMLLHPAPKRVLVVGIGSGCTVGAVLSHPGVTRVDVVEINPDIVPASHCFAEVNGRYWEDPRVRIHVEDAKTFLQLSSEPYDVIISEPTNPWIAGVAGVFSREFFETCRGHLRPDGLFTQWIQSYELEDATFFLMHETVTSVFPFYTLWNMVRTDTCLVCAPNAYAPDFPRMEARLRAPAVAADLAQINLRNLTTLLCMQSANHAGDGRFTPWFGTEHSDFFPILDYIAPCGVFTGTNAVGAMSFFDQRNETAANSNGWLHAYLAAHPPDAEELKQVSAHFEHYRSVWGQLPFYCAEAWLARAPDSMDAWAAYLRTAPASRKKLCRDGTEQPSAAILRQLPYRELKHQLGQKVNECMSHKNPFLPATGTQTAALEFMASLRERFPGDAAKDPDLLAWQGFLAYDQGRHQQAFDSLCRALSFHENTWEMASRSIAVTELAKVAVRLNRPRPALDAIRKLPPEQRGSAAMRAHESRLLQLAEELTPTPVNL